MKIEITNLDELPEVAKKIIEFSKNHKIWLLNGEMGAGKTTLSKAICAELGVIDNVSSPTFSIVNQYLTKSNETIYHFDFYRLKDETEALAIGIDEYFDSNCLCLIEWASKILSFIPINRLEINIFRDILVESEKREIEIRSF
jgi:tRNA threonylcarbamoyladenosine biosynthesis protein TsaE